MYAVAIVCQFPLEVIFQNFASDLKRLYVLAAYLSRILVGFNCDEAMPYCHNTVGKRTSSTSGTLHCLRVNDAA